jgi:predicted dinucleotide-binding enzyme
MQIGIIGAGQVGQALAKKLIKANYPVIISNSRGPESLRSLILDLGALALAGSSKDAAKADVVILAINWSKIPEVLHELKEHLSGKIVIDVSNYFPKDGKFVKPDMPTGVTVAGFIPGSKVVKAFNHLYCKWIEADAHVDNNGKRVSFISGDDAEANKIVKDIISSLGFEVIELGSLEQGGNITDIGTPLSGLNLVSYPI